MNYGSLKCVLVCFTKSVNKRTRVVSKEFGVSLCTIKYVVDILAK